MARWISKSLYERLYFQPNPLKLLACYVPSRSKSLFCDLKRGKFRFPDARDSGDDDGGQTLKSICRQLPKHPRMKYFGKGNPRCGQTLSYFLTKKWISNWALQIIFSGCMGPRGLEMILRHMAPSSRSMSQYNATCTHFTHKTGRR